MPRPQHPRKREKKRRVSRARLIAWMCRQVRIRGGGGVELSSDEVPARERVRDTQGDGDEVRGGADVTLGDAPGYTTSFTRTQVVKPRGSGPARVDRRTMEPFVELLTPHIRGTLGVPRGGLQVEVNALLNTGSGVTLISET